MLHAVFFFVAAGQLMLLYSPLHVVIYKCTDHESVLCPVFHCLCINIIMFARVLYKPASVLELLEVLGSTFVHAWVVLRRTDGEINFRFDDVVEAHFVVAGLRPCLFTVEHVVRAALYLLHQFFWWANTLERFDCCHNDELIVQNCGKVKTNIRHDQIFLCQGEEIGWY